MKNKINFNKIHFIGIGGSSMSGIAEYLFNLGKEVTGSNNEVNSNTEKLDKLGIKIFIGHNKENITNQDLVIYTKAIRDDNPELLEARDKNIKILERAEFLGLLTEYYKESICISGTHGKSTTSSLISLCFLEADKDPSIQVGAVIKNINSNNRCGNSDFFIMEACEYKDQFLEFKPKVEVILNIDADHLDYFKTFDNIILSFQKYVSLLPEDGLLVLNADDENVLNLRNYTKANVITYSIKNESDYKATNITFDENGCASFSVNDNTYRLAIKGHHNVYNALAAIIVAEHYSLSLESLKRGLMSYTGVERRFEFLGTLKNNILVYDDYAHHPTEIKTTYDSVSKTKHNKNWAIFQPHTYSRTHEHLNEFAEILKKFDNIIIAKIYAAREENIYGIKEEDLVNLIKKDNPNVIYIEEFNDIKKYILENATDNDLVISIGAGPINKVTQNLVKKEDCN
ncbi:MAG: UDP-N-acetylmuramate--L-alanine ligase [Bacilli bacterium]|nr:UDP-N-acetylmuramate--L-alanine ligase [Bacilli bacterium]